MARGEVEAAAVAARQHGVVSVMQLTELGMSASTRQRRLATGELTLVQPGVVRHCAHPDTWRGRVLAACLSTGGLASHRSAAVLWDLASIVGSMVEVTVPWGTVNRRAGVVLHRSTQLDMAGTVTIDGIPVTGLARTLIDLATVVPSLLLESAVDDALRLRRITWPGLHQAVLQHAGPGRSGCGAVRALLAARYGDGEVPLSDWSRQAARLLTDGGCPQPVFEHRVLDRSGALVAQVDLAYPIHRVAIELQSRRWHLNRRSFDADPIRWNRLTALGWRVYPITWSFSNSQPQAFCRLIEDSLRCRSQDLGA